MIKTRKKLNKSKEAKRILEEEKNQLIVKLNRKKSRIQNQNKIIVNKIMYANNSLDKIKLPTSFSKLNFTHQLQNKTINQKNLRPKS